MESHEWRERTEEGIRYFRASYHGDRWSFITTLKSEPDWYPLEPTEERWRELRDILWRKYQRKRGAWRIIADIDKMLGDDVPEP